MNRKKMKDALLNLIKSNAYTHGNEDKLNTLADFLISHIVDLKKEIDKLKENSQNMHKKIISKTILVEGKFCNKYCFFFDDSEFAYCTLVNLYLEYNENEDKFLRHEDCNKKIYKEIKLKFEDCL
jgi:hypothetical protein